MGSFLFNMNMFYAVLLALIATVSAEYGKFNSLVMISHLFQGHSVVLTGPSVFLVSKLPNDLA